MMGEIFSDQPWFPNIDIVEPEVNMENSNLWIRNQHAATTNTGSIWQSAFQKCDGDV